ncbi:MAG TPA: gamma-glutamyltransferase [Aliidongia sp.]|nr:gamma-glutamyltransferase [Aliidongia sp.]
MLALLASGCDSIRDTVGIGSSESAPEGMSSRYLGAIVADDPQAVDLARRALGSGGRAADAAVVIAVTLTATEPGRASLDGGGVCLVKGDGNSRIEELDFLPQTIAGSALPVPGLVRGMAALQARYGTMRWQQAVGPVEQLALNGITITSQLLADLAAAGLNAQGPNGNPLEAGQRLPQQGVAQTLSRLRVGGPTEFYTGSLGGELVAAGVPAQALASYVPVWRTGIVADAGNGGRIVFAQGGGGALGQAAWQALAGARPEDASAAFTAARQAGGGDAPDQAVATTGFLVADAGGQVVSCTIGMGKLFGTGQLIENLGIYGASPFDGPVLTSLAPVIAVGGEGEQTNLVLSGGEGGGASADGAAIAYLTLAGKQPLSAALSAPRSPSDGGTSPAADRIAGFHCAGGFPRSPGACALDRDPRGFGFALQADNLMR